MNTVQGHLHTQAYCEHFVGQKFRIYGMQVGCGIDHESYAMAYAKTGKKPAIGCAVVCNSGKLPINLLMKLQFMNNHIYAKEIKLDAEYSYNKDNEKVYNVKKLRREFNMYLKILKSK